MMWRPFIIDLSDMRLAYGKPREYPIKFSTGQFNNVAAMEVKVRYHLVNENRVKRINYQSQEPIDYEVFSKRIDLSEAE